MKKVFLSGYLRLYTLAWKSFDTRKLVGGVLETSIFAVFLTSFRGFFVGLFVHRIVCLAIFSTVSYGSTSMEVLSWRSKGPPLGAILRCRRCSSNILVVFLFLRAARSHRPGLIFSHDFSVKYLLVLHSLPCRVVALQGYNCAGEESTVVGCIRLLSAISRSFSVYTKVVVHHDAIPALQDEGSLFGGLFFVEE